MEEITGKNKPTTTRRVGKLVLIAGLIFRVLSAIRFLFFCAPLHPCLISWIVAALGLWMMKSSGTDNTMLIMDETIS